MGRVGLGVRKQGLEFWPSHLCDFGNIPFSPRTSVSTTVLDEQHFGSFHTVSVCEAVEPDAQIKSL